MSFTQELAVLINKYGKDNQCNTPDYILANYMNDCLGSYMFAVKRKEKHEGQTKEEPVTLSSDIKEIK